MSLEKTSHNKMFNILTSDRFYPSLIIVGGLTQTSQSTYNMPGQDPLFQNVFLCTLADVDSIVKIEHLKWPSGKEIPSQKGTSFAAPIVSGSVALLAQAFHPTLDIFAIKEVLLESAERNFYNYAEHIYIYDPEDGTPSFQAGVRFTPFDPAIYGKGVLSLRNAFIYAALKVRNPQWNSQQLRQKMKDILKAENTKPASKIQRAFRNYRIKKISKRSGPPPVPPKPLKIKTHKPTFKGESLRNLLETSNPDVDLRPDRDHKLIGKKYRDSLRELAAEEGVAEYEPHMDSALDPNEEEPQPRPSVKDLIRKFSNPH